MPSSLRCNLCGTPAATIVERRCPACLMEYAAYMLTASRGTGKGSRPHTGDPPGPGHEARLARYAERAGLGLPIFGG